MRCVVTLVAVTLCGLVGAAPCLALSEIQKADVGLTEDLQPKPGQSTDDLQPTQVRLTEDHQPKQVRRARTRLQVRPIYPRRHYNSVYPVPYSFDYPGPNAKRECVDRYVTEHRPSGTVIVPRMRCRWVRG
ncbi:MAG: hypothetical protein QOF09_2976 [Alphaproteobacteria bacterium]|jgi:hypothetical protein|nr:hypothetical protein [Alphaproteobacteria bacterium]